MSRHVTLCHVMSCHVTSCQVISRHVISRHVMPRHVTSCYAMSRHFISCHVMSRHVTSRHVMSRHVTSCHFISRHVKSCHVLSRHSTSCHVWSRVTVTRPTRTFFTRNWLKLGITLFVVFKTDFPRLFSMASSNRYREINAIAECPICAEKYRTPKQLPCTHTFCLPCLDEYCQNFPDDRSLICPLCRNPFSVPKGGCCNLPKNLLVDDLVRILQKQPTADVWTDLPETTFEVDPWTSKTCDQHPNEDLTFYCLKCKLPGCLNCLSKVHSKHEWKPIKDFLEDFQSRINVDVDKIHDTQISNIDDQLKKFRFLNKHFMRKSKKKKTGS